MIRWLSYYIGWEIFYSLVVALLFAGWLVYVFGWLGNWRYKFKWSDPSRKKPEKSIVERIFR